MSLNKATSLNTLVTNSSFVTNADVPSGSFAYNVDMRGDPEVITSHTYNNTWAGIVYIHMGGTIANQHFFIVQSVTGIADNTQTGVGLEVIIDNNNSIFIYAARIAWFTTGIGVEINRVGLITPLIRDDLWHKIAWYLDTTPTNYLDSFMMVDDVELPTQGHFTEPAQNMFSPFAVILSAGTPAGFKLGMLYDTMDITSANQFRQLLQLHTSDSPLFLGKYGTAFTGHYPDIYVKASNPIPFDSASQTNFTIQGTVNYSFTNGIDTIRYGRP